MALVTILRPTILSRAFGVRRDADSSSGSCLIIKTLVEGSIDDIKKVVLSPGFALAVTQMQHLDLPREVRRSRNRQLIFCLGNSQSEAFATLKNMMNVETARQIIQDFEHSNTKMNRLADIIEDLKTPLKKMFDEAIVLSPVVSTIGSKPSLAVRKQHSWPLLGFCPSWPPSEALF